METLIELYDERPLENVLGVDMFHPKRVVYICPGSVASDLNLQNKLRLYFRHRSLHVELIFYRAGMFDADEVLKVFRKVLSLYPDSVLDITGGTDAVLFAAGLLSAESSIPVITYSRKENKFYNIRNAPFCDDLPCDVCYTVEDCFLMAGGSMRPGRVDNSILSDYLDDIEPFFRVYLKHRRPWTKIVTFIQRLSPADSEGRFSLSVSGGYTVKGERAARISAPEDALRGLEAIGFLSDLEIVPEESVSFRFRDAQIRTWLRDVGSVLELYIYKACLDTGLFQDVITSAVVDWDGSGRQNAVTNELDVMCTRGITPVFISCKTCDVKTEALNELAILRDRFGGKIARAAIVTAEKGGAAMRNRASELGIDVFDLDDLNNLLNNRTDRRLRNLVRAAN
jgi:hypothetical protein